MDRHRAERHDDEHRPDHDLHDGGPDHHEHHVDDHHHGGSDDHELIDHHHDSSSDHDHVDDHHHDSGPDHDHVDDHHHGGATDHHDHCSTHHDDAAPTTTVATDDDVATATTTAAPGLPEAPADVQAAALAFVTAFNAATDADDVDWLFDHLAPAVIDVFGEDACRNYVEDVLVGVSGLAMQSPVRGPIDRVVEVPVPDGGTVVVDLRTLYVADIAYRFDGQSRSDSGWLQLVGQEVAYFARCAELAAG